LESRPVLAVIALTLVAALSLSFSCKDAREATPSRQETVGDFRPVAAEESVSGVPGFARVSDVLYRGGQPTREGFRKLKEMGVKTVVNLRSIHSDRELLRGVGLNYIHISFKPWHMEDEDVVEFLSVATDPRSQSVFVHCAEGVDRTGGMVAVYRMYVDGWDMEKAAEEMRQFGFHEVWVDIEAYLRQFDVEGMRKQVRSSAKPRVDFVP